MRSWWIAALAAAAAAWWGAAAVSKRAHLDAAPAPDGWCSLEGRAVSSTDGQPLKRVRLVLRREGGGRGQRLEATADSGGKFRFERLLPGNYRLAARRPGYLPEATDAAPAQGGFAFRLEAGQQVRNFRVRLVPASQIRGRVVDADGRPVPYARVLVTNSDLPPDAFGSARLARADSGGWFQASLLRPGEYRLTAFPNTGSTTPSRNPDLEAYGTRPHFWRSRSRAAFLPSEEVVVDLAAGEDLSGVRVLLRTSSPAGQPVLWTSWSW